jgi:PAS domain S-box-containing protein
MMRDVLDEVLSIFDCDRAFLVYPCDPDASSWQVPMERTKPEYPGANLMGVEVPMDPSGRQAHRAQLASDGPVKFGPGEDHPLPRDLPEKFGVKCFISMAIYPKIGKPWQFGMHQCAYVRQWTAQEEELFQETGRRIEDGLTSLLSYRNLQESEARFRTVFELSPIVAFITDRNGVFTLSEGKGLKELGLAPGEVVGKSVFEIYAHNPEIVNSFNRVLAGEEVLEIVEEAGIHYETRLTPLRGDGGGVISVIGVSVDVTERKRAEEALRRLNMELDQRVLERTAQLAAANKELEAFAYSVSHDLRAPLRHIDGFLELLQKRIETTLDEQGRHYMDTISDAAIKMGLLIDDLLAFSRMGRHAMSVQQVEPGPLVQDVIRELEPDTAGREIDWRTGDLPAVAADAAMLRMVLDNLIANAVKFTRPREKARIEIGSLPGREGDETVIYVRDNGVGFDMAYGDKLFGVFQRLHRADEFEGTGIGLANVHRIISRHGGRTWAEGGVGQGATFYFSLPYAQKGEGDE